MSVPVLSLPLPPLNATPRAGHAARLNRLAAAAALALGLPLAAQAAAQADDVGRVEVTGVATTARLGNGTRYVLDGAELAAQGVRTLDQALLLVPGLNVRNGAEGVPRIDIRGLRTRQVRLLVDGVPFNAAADGQFDPTLIPVALVEKIVVHTGPASVLYGEGGLAGTVEIVTRRGTGAPSGSVWAGVGSGSASLGGAQLAGGAGEWDYALGLEAAERGGYPVADDAPRSAVQPGSRRTGSDARRTNVLARLGWQPSAALRLALQVTGTRADHGTPPSAIDNSADAFAQRPRYERVDGIQGGSVQLSASWQPSADTVVRGWAYVLDQRQDERRFDNAALDLLLSNAIKGGYDLHADSRSQGAHLQASFALAPALSLSVAGDTRRDRFEQSGRVRDVTVITTIPGGGSGSGSGSGSGGGSGGGGGGKNGGGKAVTTTTYELRGVNDRNDASVDSLAAELGWSPREGTQLGLGLGRVQQRREADTHGGNLLSLDARQALAEDVQLRAGLARRVRAPSVAQLYDTNAGNAALALERADSAEAGVEWTLPQGRVQATLFRQEVRGLIRNDDSTGRAANLDRVNFDGLELQGQWQATGTLRLVPSYTWLRSHNVSAGAAFETLAYTPRHKLGLAARWQALPALSLGADVLHVRDQVADSRTGTPAQVRLPSYTLLGLDASWQLDPVLLTLRVDNALDRFYVTSYGFWQPGRTAWLRAQLAF